MWHPRSTTLEVRVKRTEILRSSFELLLSKPASYFRSLGGIDVYFANESGHGPGVDRAWYGAVARPAQEEPRLGLCSAHS